MLIPFFNAIHHQIQGFNIMIITGKLSGRERGRGRNTYRTFNLLNAISYTLLADNLLILFALALGAPPYCAAILGSLMYLGNAGVLLGRRTISRHGSTGNLSRAWLARSIIMIPALAAPFALPYIGKDAAFWFMLLPAAAGFYAFRAAGLVSIQPLWGEICEVGRARGRYIAELWNRATLTGLATLTVMTLVTRYSDKLEIFQGILFLGIVSGIIAGWVVFKVKESEIPRESAKKPIGDATSAIRENQSIRNYIWANCAAFSSIAILAPIPLLMVKNGFGVADDQALIFIIIQLFGSILGSSINGQVIGHTGPRPLVVIQCLFLPVICAMLYFAPDTFSWFYFGLIFVINGIALSGVPMALTNYSLNVMPEDKRVGLSLISSVVGGLGAGIAGLLFTSGLLKLLSAWGETGLDLYRWYLVWAFFFLLLLLLVIFRLKPLSDWEVKAVLGLLIAPRDIRTIYTINRLDEVADTPETEDAGIEKLSSLKSNLSLDSLLESLESPKYNVRRKALIALHSQPDNDKITEALIREMRQGEYSTAYLAAFQIGERRLEEGIPGLMHALKSGDVFLRSESMVALARLKHDAAYPRIVSIFRKTRNPRLLIHGGEALRRIAIPEGLQALLEKSESCVGIMPEKVLHEIVIYIAEMTGPGDHFYSFSKKLRRAAPEEKLEFLDDLLAYLGGGEPDHDLAMAVENYFRDLQQRSALLDLMRKRLENVSDPLLREIRDFIHDKPVLQNELLMFCLLAACRVHRVL